MDKLFMPNHTHVNYNLAKKRSIFSGQDTINHHGKNTLFSEHSQPDLPLF